MLASIIESVLVKHLGKYVDGIENNMDIGLIDGEVTVENVSLKTSFINGLGLPFILRFSHIEKIHINIPWTSLKEKNTIVTVHGIYCLLEMDYEDSQEQFDPHERLKGFVDHIKKEVKKGWQERQAKQEPETFAEKSLIRIMDNLSLSINNIHVRLESYCRNWDYSMGLVMDDINSYTVNEFEQRCFYTRSFSKKETNKVLRKIMNIGRCDVYFNQEEKVFLSRMLANGPAFMKRAMAQPFSLQEINKKKSVLQESVKQVPTYQLKLLTSIHVSMIGSQKFSEDLRYIVEVSVNIDNIDISLGSQQLSKLMFCVQHFYEYGLNIVKNGQKNYSFTKQEQQSYRAIIAKTALEEKVSAAEQKQLLAIVAACPLDLLESINDEVVVDIKFGKEIKKINKVSNVQKSKKLMADLLEKKEKLDAKEGVEIFSQVNIDLRVPRFRFLIIQQLPQVSVGTVVFEAGLLGISAKVCIPLENATTVLVVANELLLKYKGRQISTNLGLCLTDFLKLNLELDKGLRRVEVAISKKRIFVGESTLLDLLDWAMLVKLRPALVNFLAEVINYSVDITKLMMNFLFSKGRSIVIDCNIPQLCLQLHSTDRIELDLGRLYGENDDNNASFRLKFQEEQWISLNGETMLSMEGGNCLQLINKMDNTGYEKVQFILKKFSISNIDKLVKFVVANQKAKIVQVSQKLQFFAEEEQQLDGQFYLNKLKKQQIIFLTQSKLLFLPSQQSISLVRTRAYKMTIMDHFYIVLKEQVNKTINVIETKSKKVMETVYLKLKEYIHEVCTSFQWEKYYQNPYPEQIPDLKAISSTGLENRTQLMLTVSVQRVAVEVDHDAELELRDTAIRILYNQLNTEASLQLRSVNLIIDTEKVIYDAIFKASYTYLQSMNVKFEVERLSYTIKRFQTFSRCIAIAGQYSLLVDQLPKKEHRYPVDLLEDPERLKFTNTESTANAPAQFLLENLFIIDTQHIEGDILGYKNKLEYISVRISKFRNDPELNVELEMRGIILFSMLSIPSLSYHLTAEQMLLKVNSINLQANMQIILYEVVKGQGRLIVLQIIRVIKQKRLAQSDRSGIEDQSVTMIKDVTSQQTLVTKHISISVMGFQTQILLTENLCVGMQVKQVSMLDGCFMWQGVNFWLNCNCISTSDSNGIAKVCEGLCIDICMTTLKLRLNSKEAFELSNEINKMAKFFKKNNFSVEEMYRQEMDDLELKIASKCILHLRVDQLQVIYEQVDTTPLLSLRMKPVFLSNSCETNTLKLELWHLNRNLKLYEPVIQPLQLIVTNKWQNKQIQVVLEDMKVVVTQQLLSDVFGELRLLQKIQEQFQRQQQNQFQSLTPLEVQKKKKLLEHQPFREYDSPNFADIVEYSSILKIINRLHCAALVEVSCGQSIKQTLYFEQPQSHPQTISIPQKSHYNSSYELIQRYKRVHLKISTLSRIYAMETRSYSFLLYDEDNIYVQPVLLTDDQGNDLESTLALKLAYLGGVYVVEIVSRYSLLNSTRMPIYVRYIDITSISKFVLQPDSEPLHLPPWVIDCFSFGFVQDQFPHVLQLSAKKGTSEGTGEIVYQAVQEPGRCISLLIKKEEQAHQQRQVKNKNKHQTNDNKQQKHVEPIGNPCTEKIFNFQILSAVLCSNHLKFGVKLNGQYFEPSSQQSLNRVLSDKGKEYIRVELGDGSYHDIYIPDVESSHQVSLKLAGDNYVAMYLQTRLNSRNQRVLHLYSELHLIVNIPNVFDLTIVTNIYGNLFAVKKRVENNLNDRMHPEPVLKDRFVFNTYDYLLTRNEKYLRIKTHNTESNEIILYESDSSQDLILKDNEGSIVTVFAVSYETSLTRLDCRMEIDKAETLQCCFAYVVPKYYLSNRSATVLLVNGSTFVRSGEKIVLSTNQHNTFALADYPQNQFIGCDIENASNMLFVEREEMTRFYKALQSEETEDYRSNLEREGAQGERLDVQNDITYEPQQDEEECKQNQPNIELQIDKDEPSAQKQLPQQLFQEDNLQPMVSETVAVENTRRQCLIAMKNIKIFSLQRRGGSHNTLLYDISEWNEWLTFRNELTSVIIVRSRVSQDIVGQERIDPQQCGRIIIGISDTIEISSETPDGEILFGEYSLHQRLNANIVANDEPEIVLKQRKIKTGRFIVITTAAKGKECARQNVIVSIAVNIKQAGLSLILHEDSHRKELWKINAVNLSLLTLQYRNGLYMMESQLQMFNTIFRQTSVVTLQKIRVYLEGFHGQFVERVELSTPKPIEITITDELILTIMEQIELLKGLLAVGYEKNSKDNKGETNAQNIIKENSQQCYYVNSLLVSALELKFTVKKSVFKLTERKRRIFNNLSFSIIQVEDAILKLSAIQIDEPLTSRTVEGIQKMYAMESIAGIALGMNIIGNPKQFAGELQAGKNRGGVFAFLGGIVAATSNSLSKMIGTVGNGISQLTFDHKYQLDRVEAKEIKAESFLMGLKLGAMSFAKSIKSGFVGLVQQPIQGYRQSGQIGILTGSFAGLTGLLIKPFTGLVDATSKTIEGINYSTSYVHHKLLELQQRCNRPLYHRFELVRPYRSEDQLAYNLMIHWYGQSDIQLVGGYLLQDEQGDSMVKLLVITCSQLILISLAEKTIDLRLRNEELLAIGKFNEGVVLYFQDGEEQDEIVFNMRKDHYAKDNLYWTLKGFIGLYAQGVH